MKKKAFARYTKKGQLVPGSLVVTTKGGYPDKTSLWKEIPTWFNDGVSENYGSWKIISGGLAGDGKVLSDGGNDFTFVGPNDGDDNGWVYVKRQFPVGAILNISYDWASYDEGTNVDRPVYWTSTTEPTGIPEDTNSKAEGTPESGTWNITVNPGEWFAIGIYSTDSCCGRGFLSIEMNVQTDVYIEYQIPSDPFSIINPYAKLKCNGTQVSYQYINGGGPYTTIQSLVNAFNADPNTSTYGTFLNAGSNSVGLRLSIATVLDVCGPGTLTLEIGED